MSTNKIEYSRLLIKRTDQTGETPTIPPVSAVTLNQMIATDLLTGEFFLNTVDDLMWIRTNNGILPISISGSSGSTEIQNLSQVLFQGNETDGYDIVVTNGDTIQFQGITTGVSSTYLALDNSGNTIAVTGTTGSSGTSGSSGTNGTSGSSGTNGTSGSSGTNGTSGVSGLGLYLPLSGGTVTGATKFTSTFSLAGLTSGGSQTLLTVDSDTGQVYTTFRSAPRYISAVKSTGQISVSGNTDITFETVVASNGLSITGGTSVTLAAGSAWLITASFSAQAFTDNSNPFIVIGIVNSSNTTLADGTAAALVPLNFTGSGSPSTAAQFNTPTISTIIKPITDTVIKFRCTSAGSGTTTVRGQFTFFTITELI